MCRSCMWIVCQWWMTCVECYSSWNVLSKTGMGKVRWLFFSLEHLIRWVENVCCMFCADKPLFGTFYVHVSTFYPAWQNSLYGTLLSHLKKNGVILCSFYIP